MNMNKLSTRDLALRVEDFCQMVSPADRQGFVDPELASILEELKARNTYASREALALWNDE